MTRSLACALVVFLVSLASAHSAAGQAKNPAAPIKADHLVIQPDDISWKPLHPGSEIAVLSGDPGKAGAPFVIRLRYRGVVKIPAHWHPTDEHITVLSGTFLLGMGERADEASAVTMKTGGYAWVETKMAHFAWAKDDAVLQVHGIGPFTINYVNPLEDPNRAPTQP